MPPGREIVDQSPTEPQQTAPVKDLYAFGVPWLKTLDYARAAEEVATDEELRKLRQTIDQIASIVRLEPDENLTEHDLVDRITLLYNRLYEIASDEKRAEDAKQWMREVDGERDRLTHQLEAVTHRLRKAEETIAAYKEHLAQESQEIAINRELEAAARESIAASEEKDRTIQRLEARIKALTDGYHAEIAAAERRAEEASQQEIQRATDRLRAEEARLRTQYAENASERTVLATDVRRLEGELESASKEIAKLQRTRDELRQINASKERLIQEISNAPPKTATADEDRLLTQRDQEIKRLRTLLAETEQKYASSQVAHVMELEERLARIEEELGAREAEIERLQRLLDKAQRASVPSKRKKTPPAPVLRVIPHARLAFAPLSAVEDAEARAFVSQIAQAALLASLGGGDQGPQEA